MFNQIIVNIVVSFSLNALVALSFSIFYYPSKFFNLAHAIVITLSAYSFFFFTKQISISLWLSVPISIFITSLFGASFFFTIYFVLLKRNISSIYMLILSLGLYIVLQNSISILWGDDTKSIRFGDVKIGNEIFGAYITNIQIITIVVSISLLIFTILLLKYFKIGRNIRAVAVNSELANIQGINSNKIILWSIVIGSGLAAIAGILVASDTGMTPTMGFNLLLYGIVAMIIGGVGSTWGLVGGALLLATAQHLTAYYIDSKWMDAVTYVILIFFLIWKPLGFSGKRLKKIEI